MNSLAQKTLAHKASKDSTAKWFIFALIPVLNLYWLWKAAEIVSGHEKIIRKQHEAIGHPDSKDSTAKWFGIFLVPTICGVLLVLLVILGIFMGARGMGFTPAVLGIGIILMPILGFIAFVAGIYALYKMAECVSGHETVYPKEYETVGHKDVKDSTGKWMVFGIIPILNLYFVWKMSETISGHEEMVGGSREAVPRESRSEPSKETSKGVRYCPNCGSELEENVKFCPECGAEV